MKKPAILAIIAALALGGCSAADDSHSDDDDGTTDSDSDSDSDTDTDTDGDTDTDTDTDTDSDTDTGSDTDTTPDAIEVVITADNAYGFGYGTETEMANYYGGIENMTAGEIFNCSGGPEVYEIDPSAAAGADYLYIIGWADGAVTQGVLGQFRRSSGMGDFGPLVYTGDEDFEVCATGQNYNPGSGGPDLATINEMILWCNNGDAMDPDDTSMGWVDTVGTEYGALAVGEDNTTPYDSYAQPGNEFPIVCQDLMDEEATWMWFNWDPASIVWPTQSPFMWPGGTNPDHQFLIFRLEADSLPPIE